MKKASAASTALLLLALAAPACAWLSSRQAQSPSKPPLLPRTDKSFGNTDTNKDGVISKQEFILQPRAAPGPAPAPVPVGAQVLSPAPATVKQTVPAGLQAGREPAPAPPRTTSREQVHLVWPKHVVPGTNWTTRNVNVHPDTGKIIGVWRTENTSAWKGDTSKMPGENLAKASKAVTEAVSAAAASTQPPKSIDGPATAAAKQAVRLGGEGDTVAAAAAGASGGRLPAVTLSFELKNINYYMLDEPGYRSPAIGSRSELEQSHFSLSQSTGPVDLEPVTLEDSVEHEATNSELIEGAIKQCLEQLLSIAFGDVSSVPVGEDVHPDMKKHVAIGHKVVALSQKNAPVQAPAPAAVAAVAPMPAAKLNAEPAPAPAPVAREEPRFRPAHSLPKIGVSFMPGRSLQHFVEEQSDDTKQIPTGSVFMKHALRRFRSQSHSRAGAHRGHYVEALSTIAKVELVESRNKPAHVLDATRNALSMYVMDGTLSEALSAAVAEAVDMKPIVGVIQEGVGQVAPYNVSSCASHIHKLVNGFSQAYTRRQVIPTLYAACTHYGQKVSFSHDEIIDKADQRKCRVATKRFAHLWQYGKGKVDYGGFCLQLCELRYGRDSVQCDAHKHFIGPGEIEK